LIVFLFIVGMWYIGRVESGAFEERDRVERRLGR
jgi:hypothetical protein